jgi:hypothetical protein
MLTGTLHVVVAFDWGDEIDLDRVCQLVPAQTYAHPSTTRASLIGGGIRPAAPAAAFPRRPRTPRSIAYQPAPLQLALAPIGLDLPEIGRTQASADATVFDFAAISVALRIPFSLTRDQLLRLAGWLGDPVPIFQAVQIALLGVFEQLKSAIRDPGWNVEFHEVYVVFELPPDNDLPPPATLLDPKESDAAWLAGLVRLENGPLSESEITEALRLHISYFPEDLFVADWSAAVLLDSDCEETLETVEFANLQLLEFRHIDSRLDASLAEAYRLVHRTTHRWLPFWRTHTRPLRWLGELKVEANGLFERTGNALKLVGDAYLARVYRLLASRFALDTWQRSIERSLHVAEDVYRVLADQAAAFRNELLEVLVVVLILIEIVVAFWKY